MPRTTTFLSLTQLRHPPSLHYRKCSSRFPMFHCCYTNSRAYSSREPFPEESQQPEEPTLGLPDSPAHPGSQRDCPLPRYDQSPAPLVADAALADIIPPHRDDATTTESVKPICHVHGPSPPTTESSTQVVAKCASPVCEQQR